MKEKDFGTLYQIYEASNALSGDVEDTAHLDAFMQPICIRCEAVDWLVVFNNSNEKDLRVMSKKKLVRCDKELLVDVLPILFFSDEIEETNQQNITTIFNTINQANTHNLTSGILSGFEVNSNESVILLLLYADQLPHQKHMDEFKLIKNFLAVFISASYNDSSSNNMIDELRNQIRRQNTWMEALGWINQAKVDETHEQSTRDFYKEMLFQVSILMNAKNASLFELEDDGLIGMNVNKNKEELNSLKIIVKKIIDDSELTKQSVWSKTSIEVDYLAELYISHLVLFPLFIEDKLFSVLSVSKNTDEFDASDKSIGRLFTDGVEKIIERRWFLGKINKKNLAIVKEKDEQKLLVKKLNDAKEQILQSEKMASIGQLAAGVAHEINNPVGYVGSNISSLTDYIKDLFSVIDAYEKLKQDGSDNSQQFGEIDKIKAEVDLGFIRDDVGDLLSESLEGVTRVKQIVQDLKDFSHADKIVWQSTNIHKGMDSTLNIVANELKYNVNIVKNYGDIPMIDCMPSQINQVLMNLFVNAGHAITDQGTLTITTSLKDPEHIMIQVADTGKGIEEENLKRIFDPFFTTKEVGKGTGLGLSLSYGIVEKHHGSISVESEVGVGTTFRVIIPIKQEPEEDS